MLLSELLDDHRDALKARECEVADLRRKMEGLSATGKATTEESSWLKVDLGREVVARSSREDVVQLRVELEKKGSEMLKRNPELQQESALLAAQQELKEMRQRAEEAEAVPRSGGMLLRR